jgi:hypothetical protein
MWKSRGDAKVDLAMKEVNEHLDSTLVRERRPLSIR